MSNKRHPNECPTCKKIPCKCAGGGAGDEDKAKKDNEASVENKRNESSVNNTVNNDEKAHTTILNQENQLLCCMFFSSPANQPAPVSPNPLHEDNASNTANTTLTMRMTMGGIDE